MENPSRPLLNAALLCEKVLVEKDGSLSLIRIADRIEIATAGIPEGAKPIFSIQGLVGLKSGPVTGEFVVKIKVRNPTGEITGTHDFPIKLAGEDQGANLILHMNLGLAEEGLYWFEIFFEDEMLTQIPLMVIWKRREKENA